MPKILIIGGGGREHALAWKFSQAPNTQIYAAPGNAGMSAVAQCVNISENDFDGLLNFAKKNAIDLTVVGPETPLVNGIVDQFTAAGLPIFGPTAKAAAIEGSKNFAKNLMQKYDIPTAKHHTFTDVAAALLHVKTAPLPTVIKADGLAGGKGVIIAETAEQAQQAVESLFKLGDKLIVEEFLQGEEFSFIALVHGETVYPLEIAQDHKRAHDGDKGANTGGMGVYSPVPQISQATIQQALTEILQPTAAAMVAENRPFTGFLYGGLIATAGGAKVIEFNARLGDPEAEVILPRLQNNLFEVIMDILHEKPVKLAWKEETFVAVTLAACGYPGDITKAKGAEIAGLQDLSPETLIFHAGTAFANGKFTVNGGRVLFVAACGENVQAARTAVYSEVAKIQCNGLFYRKDIGAKAIL
ncbi:MAG: phosphoribosylamine--glycine ligase [Firmicutes bacterium]|nr:phosphoribosylamine--glycine ligase [Bacillota bacterium]